MTERVLQQAVVELAHLFGWLTYHTFDSRHSVEGFPDLVLLRGEELLFVELKVGKNKPTDKQQYWIDSLRVVPGIGVYVWHEYDWTSGKIEGALR